MSKTTTALSGASKQAYFRRLLADEMGAGAPAAQKLLARIDDEIRHVRVRSECLDRNGGAVADTVVEAAEECPQSSPKAFDPYAPNAIVVLRTRGAAALLEELGKIEDADQLRQLAKAQQLSVAAEVVDCAGLRAAIVVAAERRVANRRAAGS